MSPAFRPQPLASYVELMLRRTNAMLDRWPPAGEVAISDEISTLTLGIVMESLFGADAQRFADRFTREVAVLNEAALRDLSAPFVPPDWFPLVYKRRTKDAIAFLDHVVNEMIADRRRTNEDRGDLLSMMLLAVDEEGDRTGMTDRQARDEAVVLLLAGNETTATAPVWSLHLLAGRPEAQDRVAAEAESVLASEGALVPDLERFPFAEMVLKESMRLYLVGADGPVSGGDQLPVVKLEAHGHAAAAAEAPAPRPARDLPAITDARGTLSSAAALPLATAAVTSPAHRSVTSSRWMGTAASISTRSLRPTTS